MAGICLAKMSLGCAQGDGLNTLFLNGERLSGPSLQTVSCGTATLSGLSQTVTAGQPVSLTVSLTGQNPWSCEVYRNGDYLIGANGVTTSPVVFATTVSGSSTLTLRTVSNACGTLPTSGTVLLTVPCMAPASLTEANETATSFEARWVSWAGNYYQIQWKESSASSWTVSPTICCSDYYVGNLELGKNYQWRISTVCADGATSVWSIERTVMISCPVALGQSELVSPTQAVLRWSYMNIGGTITSLRYNLQWRAVGASSWTTVSNTCCSDYTLSNLAMGQAYEWQIPVSYTHLTLPTKRIV